MVGHRFVEAAIERGLTETHDIVVIGEEPRPAYDRVALTSYFERGADDLVPAAARASTTTRGCASSSARPSSAIDRETRTVALADGAVVGYDELVLATGSAPFVPPVPGNDLPGCFVYRTIEDLDAIRAAAATGPRRRRGRRRPARAGGRERAAASSASRRTSSRWRRG